MSARGTSRAALEREIERLRGELDAKGEELRAVRTGYMGLEDTTALLRSAQDELKVSRDIMQRLREATMDYQLANAQLYTAQEDAWDFLYYGASEAEVND